MNVLYKQLEKGEGELTVTLDVAEMQPHLERAAVRIARETTFEGFRPGTAPYAVVRSRVGDMRLYEVAAEDAVRLTYPKVIHEQHLETVGSPRIDVMTLVPGNPFIYKATAPLLPSVELGDYASLRVDAKPVEVAESEIDKTVGELQRIRASEALVDRATTPTDKVIVDMQMMRDGVPVDGGQTKNHAIILSDPYFIPGFTDAVLGMRASEIKTFTLTFPKDHYQKHLAGKPVDFTVTMNGVYARALPALDDTFAIALGQKSMSDLRALLKKNMEEEQRHKEDQRQEIALLDQLVERSKFGEIPVTLLTQEARRMMQEFEQSITERGVVFEEYLQSIKKTRDALFLEFAPEAVKRVKAMLVIRTVGKQENVSVTDAELQQETEQMIVQYAKDAETQTHIRGEDGQDYIRGVVRNRKVIAFLKAKNIRS